MTGSPEARAGVATTSPLLAVGDREQMGSGAATVISIGRVLSRTYQGPSAQDGW